MLRMLIPDLNVRASIQQPRNGSSPTILTRMNRPTRTGERMLHCAGLGPHDGDPHQPERPGPRRTWRPHL